ncbi:MAG: hypothetical protein ACTSVI_08435 [Promethearchaeota archaeon]
MMIQDNPAYTNLLITIVVAFGVLVTVDLLARRLSRKVRYIISVPILITGGYF